MQQGAMVTGQPSSPTLNSSQVTLRRVRPQMQVGKRNPAKLFNKFLKARCGPDKNTEHGENMKLNPYHILYKLGTEESFCFWDKEVSFFIGNGETYVSGGALPRKH